ncbi:MAG: hypothetical protein WC156_14150 [Pedobacter sp.]
MGKTKVTPRYNVVSMRVSEKERQVLQNIALCKKLSISEMMRQAMERLSNNRYGSDMGDTA